MSLIWVMEAEIIEIARELGVRDEALKKWRQRGSVPHRWRLPIMREAKVRGIELSENIFDNALPKPRAGAGG